MTDRKELISILHCEGRPGWPTQGPYSPHNLLPLAGNALAEADAEIERLRAAVLAERETCAEIADGGPYMEANPDWALQQRTDYDSGQIDAGVSIATAIRARPQP